MTVVFDLDDTLYKELDYVRSGRVAVRRYIEANALDADPDGEWTDEMRRVRRQHLPDIRLDSDTAYTLAELQRRGVRMAVITDGHTDKQTLKFRALGLERYIDPADLSISEAIGADKTSALPFEAMMRRHPDEECWVYVGDNPAKDFTWPNRLGWLTVMLRDTGGVNVHPQLLPEQPEGAPRLVIDRLSELTELKL